MKELDFRLEKLLFNLDALAELGEVLTSPEDYQRIVRSSLYMIMGTFSASSGAILRYDKKVRSVKPIVSKGVGNENDIALELSELQIKEMAGLKRPVDLKEAGALQGPLETLKTDLERVKARIVAPLVVKEEFLGFITVSGKFSGDEYTKDDFRLLSVMAHHIAVSLHSHSLLNKLIYKYGENRKLYDNLSRIYYDTIHAFAAAIDAKDAYTKGHSHRVATYCATLAKEIGWGDEETEGIRIAGLLHDIGKIAVDRSIINKESPLTKDEMLELNSHPVIGYDILSRVKFPWDGVSKMTRNHHERIDGNGYPDRLRGDNIPLGAKIMSLADAFDAMTTDRSYRMALSAEEALSELQRHSGKQFDDHVVQSFLSILYKEISGVNKPSVLPLLSSEINEELKAMAGNGTLSVVDTRVNRRQL
ncbi:MAG: HD-GYP domain-containing protein [Thermodesulfobacteriota bacterium]